VHQVPNPALNISTSSNSRSPDYDVKRYPAKQ
jgi:hypothetical protein